MISTIIQKFMKFFDDISQRQEDLDRYIYNKNPRDQVELEFWLRHYDRSRSNRSWI
jgi:hypothetical protein